jgi:hypothetical protein
LERLSWRGRCKILRLHLISSWWNWKRTRKKIQFWKNRGSPQAWIKRIDDGYSGYKIDAWKIRMGKNAFFVEISYTEDFWIPYDKIETIRHYYRDQTDQCQCEILWTKPE